MPESVQDGRSILRIIHSAGFTSYASLAVVCMFSHSKQINIKTDNAVKIDCDKAADGSSSNNAPLFLARMILLESFETNRSLASLQQVMFSLHSIAHVSELESLVVQKTELLFENQADSGFDDDTELIEQLGQNATWINKTIVNGDKNQQSDKETRRFLFLSVFLLN